jgi:uncharacterized protein YlxP (DUF503 family)
MASVVGLLHLDLHVAQAMSLKDKRRIVQSFKARVSNGFNVSIAEVDALDSHRHAVLAVAMVANDRTYIEGALQKIVNMAASHRDMVLVDHQVEWL